MLSEYMPEVWKSINKSVWKRTVKSSPRSEVAVANRLKCDETRLDKKRCRFVFIYGVNVINVYRFWNQFLGRKRENTLQLNRRKTGFHVNNVRDYL